jgi:DNA-directed RNA polymerase specialized sigma24 family protein
MEEIYEAARTLLPAARAFAQRFGIAAHDAEDLLMEAAVKVIDFRQRHRGEGEIEHLPSYVWTTYKHLLSAHAREAAGEQELTDEGWELLPGQVDPFQKIMAEILFEEVVRRLDAQTRFIFEGRLLHYSFEEIAAEYLKTFGERINVHVLRNKYYRTVDKLRRELARH